MSFRFPPPHDPHGGPPAPFEELVDGGVSAEELERLRRTDALLRSVPGPPAEVPASLTRAVTGPSPRRSWWNRRRVVAAAALAAALSALSFAAGALVSGGDGFEERASFTLRGTAQAEDATARILVGERDADGNWPLRLEVEGLPELPEGGYYTLWLAREGERGPICGSFAVGEGKTEAEWTVSYRLAFFDQWVVTAWLPDGDNENPPRLMEADVTL